MYIFLEAFSLFFLEKSHQRPPRKAYGRLSVESDDITNSIQNKDYFSSSDLDNNLKSCRLSRNKNRINANGNNVEVGDDDNNGVGGGDVDATDSNRTTDMFGNFDDSDSDLDLNEKLKQAQRNRRIDAQTISRLQAMAMSDDDDDFGKFILNHIHMLFIYRDI